jgi:hypothetical protein
MAGWVLNRENFQSVTTAAQGGSYLKDFCTKAIIDSGSAIPGADSDDEAGGAPDFAGSAPGV